ncbi:MAG TPA: cupin domain-containing protein [Dehalococcoidia bacterium]|nr:cupin domain-containing protein [Dehalococcoidia bacterium]
MKTRGNAPYDVVARQVTIAPGGHTGWHTHPGPAIAIVKQGTLTIYDGDDPSCSAGTISAGEVYIDPGYGHVHTGRNEGGTPLELHITFLDVPPDGSPTIDIPEAPGNCPF